MILLICGDRNWNNAQPIRRELSKLHGQDVTIIHGCCRGADMTAARIAKEEFGFAIKGYPADWKTYGRAAGPIRNIQMLTEGKPDEVWAFHSNLKKSKGTKHTVTHARIIGIPVKIFNS